MSDSLLSHRLQHVLPPCPSLFPKVRPSWCLLNRWCHPAISSSIALFLCLQSFPASGSFQMSQFFTSSGQSIGVSASAEYSVNIQDWFPLQLTGWISLQSKGLFKSLLQHRSSKASILWHSAFFIVQLSHPYIQNGGWDQTPHFTDKGKKRLGTDLLEATGWVRGQSQDLDWSSWCH